MQTIRDERREFSRAAIRLQVKVIADDTTLVSATTRDVSLQGLFIVTDRPLAVKTACQLVLQLETSDGLVFMPAAGRVVRAEPEGMAVAFTELGQECYPHLHQLIHSHAAEPARQPG